MGKASEQGRLRHQAMIEQAEQKRKELNSAIEHITKQDGYRYGVMRLSGSSMKFKAIHESIEKAEEQAILLLADSVQKGDLNPVFSIIKVEKSYTFDGSGFKEVV